MPCIRPQSGDAEGPIEAFRASRLVSGTLVSEGTSLFDEYRACSMREVERSLLLSTTHYRRFLDALVCSSAPWAQVTAYYGTWYATRALLGMFGCTIFKKYVVDVSRSVPSHQQLRVRRIGGSPGQQSSTYSGSHRIYWDLFYQAVVTLPPYVPAHLAPALTPIAGDPVWPIDRRNSVNYDTLAAIRLAKDFERTFVASGFPSALPGSLGTQYALLDAMLELAMRFAKQFNLGTDALAGLGPNGNLVAKLRALVYGSRAPSLITRTKKSVLLGP